MKILAGLAVLLAFFHVLWTGGMAARSYWQMSDVVDRAFELEERGRLGAPGLRQAVLHGATEVGVPLAAEDIVVVDQAGGLAVRLRWTWPIVSWQGTQVLQVPLTLERARLAR